MFSLPHFIHIGFPRTASTWLQGVFSNHPEICFRFRPKFFNWEDNWLKGRDYYHSLFEAKKGQQIILDSDEAYSIGRQIRKTGWNVDKIAKADYDQIKPFVSSYDPWLTAERIYQTNPKAKIIAVLRRQDEWFLSAYRFYVATQGESYSFNYFLSQDKVGQGFYRAGFYHSILKVYRDLFGKENVLVLLYEEISEDEKKFLEKISRFLGVNLFLKSRLNQRPRKGMGDRGVKIMRQANKITKLLPKKRKSLYYRIISRIIGFIDRTSFHRLKGGVIIHLEEKRTLLNIYQDDNKKLEKEFGVNLNKWRF